MTDDPSKRGPCRSSRRRRRAPDVDVYTATGTETDSPEAAGTKIISEFVRRHAQHRPGCDLMFFAGSRSDAFFFDFDGITKLSRRGRNFTAPPSASRREPAWLIDHRLAFLLEGGHSTLRPQAAYRHS